MPIPNKYCKYLHLAYNCTITKTGSTGFKCDVAFFVCSLPTKKTAKISKKDLRSHSSFESTCRTLLKTDFMQYGLSRIQHECVAHNLTCMLPLVRLKPHHLDWIRLQTQVNNKDSKCMSVGRPTLSMKSGFIASSKEAGRSGL